MSDVTTELAMEASDKTMQIARLKAENDRLRELVSDMMRAWWACDNEACPRHDERCEKGKYCAFDECAQELGIEVDE